MTDKRLTIHTGKSKRGVAAQRPRKKPSARKIKRAADLFAPKR